MSKRQERENIFKQLLDAGYDAGTAGAIANRPNIHNAHKGFRNAMASAPGKPAPQQSAPKPPKPPKTPKPAEQTMSTISQAGEGVRRPGGKRKKTTLASLRIKPRKINQQVGGLGSGGSLNIGGY
jgi:hypothetical protein